MHPETEQSCLLTQGHRTVSHARAQDNPRHTRCCWRDTYQHRLCCARLLSQHTLPATTNDSADEPRLH